MPTSLLTYGLKVEGTNSSGTITLFVSFIMVKQGYVFVYNRSKIGDLFILQFVYFASRKHLFYFHQFNLFYKLGPQ